MGYNVLDSNNNHLEEAFHLLARTIVRSDPSRLEAWAGLGLTMTQLRVLFLVRENDGASAGMLADSLKVTPSTLTRIMDRLVRNHLVQRKVDDGDRRLVRHYLTASAQEMVGELERTGREEFYAIFQEMTPAQIERLIAGLRDLAVAAEAAESHRDSPKASVA
jgi:DNA-binding MarR family transcriptional regulator